MNSLAPRLETLPDAQRLLWPRLAELGADFVLYGGTALSLQVGGRISVDFDFFSPRPVDPLLLQQRWTFLQPAILRQQAENTATFVLGHGAEAVALSFFGGLTIGRVSDPVRFADNRLPAAGLLDLAAQKVKVVQSRAAGKDYLDVATLLGCGVTLELALGAAASLYPGFNPTVSLKALGYFEDVPEVPVEVRRRLVEAVARVRSIPSVPLRSDSLLPES